MSNDFVVRSSFHDYSVSFVDDLVGSARNVLEPDDLIIIDKAVAAAHRNRLVTLLENRTVLEVEASERAKSFDRVGGTIEAVVESGFRRGNRIVVIGGGVLQDISAFIATVIFRGVDWHFVPTTLLAQADSCIGGKSSINFRGYKNLLGSFLPPQSIMIDVEFLSTLPPEEVTSGIGEILHFLVYSGEDDFAFLEGHIDSVRTDPDRMRQLIARSLAIKKPVVEEDEFDRGIRMLFNYGHSFGHAIEAVSGYGIPHGIAVSFGIDIANYVSAGIGMTSDVFRDRVRAVAANLWEGYSIRDLDVDGIFKGLRKDKKNIGKDVYVILTEGFGRMAKTRIDLDNREGALIRRYFAEQAP